MIHSEWCATRNRCGRKIRHFANDVQEGLANTVQCAAKKLLKFAVIFSEPLANIDGGARGPLTF